MKKIIAAIVAFTIAVSRCSTLTPSTQTMSAAYSESDATIQANGET